MIIAKEIISVPKTAVHTLLSKVVQTQICYAKISCKLPLRIQSKLFVLYRPRNSSCMPRNKVLYNHIKTNVLHTYQ